MIFGDTALDEAEGVVLAHSLKLGKINFKKGRILSAADVQALRNAGLPSVIAARLELGDVPENQAAAAIAETVCGQGLSASAAFTGRSNLIVEHRGVLVLDPPRLHAINQIDEAITLATLAPFELVEPRQLAATVKIIPFAVAGSALKHCLEAARSGSGPLIQVAAFRPRPTGLIQTSLPGMKTSLFDKTKAAVDARLAALDCPASEELRCVHKEDDLAQAISALCERGLELVFVSGASAIVDRRDVIPAAIRSAGGSIDHFGMPVDPGNLILIGKLGNTTILGLPGCARSPKVNGFDWVLQRLVADLPIGRKEIMAMGAGGLLKEIPARPLPRAEAVEEARAPRAAQVAAVVLAAGQSRRMGPENKLLAELDGKAMVAQVVEQAIASQAKPVIVVTGHEQDRVASALAGYPVQHLHNPDYRAGLSTSLHKGLAALPPEADAVVVCLGDMPKVEALVIDRLIAAFNPLEGRSICVPTWRGKRGNPVLFARRFVPEMQEIAGDVGARHLIGEYPEAVCEVAMDDVGSGAGVLLDIDTPEVLARLTPTG